LWNFCLSFLHFVLGVFVQIQVKTNPVNRIANLQSSFMNLTRICDYPYQTNIPKFTAYCPSVRMLAI